MRKRYLDTMKGMQFSRKRTICEVHREIYDLMVLEIAEQNPELFDKLADLLEEAFWMGIKICEKLMTYKLDNGFDKDMEKNDEVVRLRRDRIRLVQMLKSREE